MTTIGMISPVGSGLSFSARSGTVYTADAYGLVNITTGNFDVADALNAGFTYAVAGSGRNNFSATTDPGATNDSTQDYVGGSRWLNTTTNQLWECVSNTASAAVWAPLTSKFAARLLAANMNSTADQAMTMFVPTSAKFRVTKITVKNASISLTTAAGGVYPAAAKAGTAVVAAGQAYSSLTTTALALDLTLAASTTVQAAATILYLSLTTAQGSAATADVYVYGDIYI